MTNATKLALWIRASAGEPLSHLKLQKLAFYCYGAALADDREGEVGEILFEAWEHGPVNREIYKQYASHKAQPISPPDSSVAPAYSRDTEQPLRDALSVYGKLDAWGLRQQSHLERPWIDAWNARSRIRTPVLKEYFRQKFSGRVEWPEWLLRGSSLALDGVPSGTFASLHDLAEVVRAH